MALTGDQAAYITARMGGKEGSPTIARVGAIRVGYTPAFTYDKNGTGAADHYIWQNAARPAGSWTITRPE